MEVELAVSSVVGSGLFVCCVSLAAVILVSPVEIHDRVAFVSVPANALYLFPCAFILPARREVLLPTAHSFEISMAAALPAVALLNQRLIEGEARRALR